MDTIKGKITRNGDKSFTCCDSRPDIYIGGKSLHDALLEAAKLPDLSEDDSGNKGKEWRIRYIVRDIPFSESEDFETACAEIVENQLSSDVVRGCYSEWTCGYGDYDFILRGKHSLLTELASHENNHVWIILDDESAVETGKQ